MPGTTSRVLLLEDDRSTSDYVMRGLIEAGHVCDAFADGAHALVQATHEHYDVLVIDRMVPGLDGLTLEDNGPGLRVVVGFPRA